ncbi:MAG: single-stranded-DNA-specific exonuclease RecJ, partial [Ruminococcus sp.]|nr:single-stranded-DNA-specific exonuclease RecJ [Ruminococcus sp.]
SGKGWSHGVIGIVAARIMEYYGKPVILISEEGGEARGSARSIKGFNIFKCFQYADDLLVKYGGHECAGGLTILPEDIDEFKDRVYEYASQFDEMPAITVSADKLLLPEDITLSHVKGLAALEPFGEGNPQPVFAMLGAVVTNITPLSQGKHSKLSVSYGSLNTQALVFGTSPDKLSVTRGERVDMLVNLDVNVFNGNESVSIKVIDHRPSGFNQNAYFSAKDCYEKLKRGEELPPNFIRKIIPERDELINVYKTLQRVKSINVDRLYFMFDAKAMNFCKLMICIDIFKELGLVTYRAGSRTVTLAPVSGKADLESSELLKFLREKQKG